MAKKLQMCGTESEMREQVGKICRNYLHGAWKTVTPQELDFNRISGGLSNFLYYIALPETKSTTSYPPSSSPTRSDPEPMQELSPETLSAEQDGEKKSPISRFLKQRALSRSNSFNMEEPKKVLLRIYGQVHGERAMDAIITEAVIFTLLSERKLGPKLHGVFSGGRIEEYIPARPLLTRELSEPALSMKIAEKMAAIHSMDVPLTKEPTWLWKTMGRWVKTTYERLENEPKDDIERRVLPRLKTVDWDKEISWLKNYLATVDSPVVFCHNDMQEGNILMREDDNVIHHNPDDDINDFHPYREHDQDETMSSPELDSCTDTIKSDKENDHRPGRGDGHQAQCLRALRLQFAEEDANTTDSVLSHSSDNGEPRLVLIDFEYCSYNYRGFDIANHFVEWTYDYTNPQYPFYHEALDNYPTLEQKEIFLRQYLKHFNTIVSEDPSEDANPSIEEVNALNCEVEALTLASHLMWALWGVVNATKSQITFGYWEYALARLENYQRLKQEIIKKENLGVPLKRKIEEVDI